MCMHLTIINTCVTTNEHFYKSNVAVATLPSLFIHDDVNDVDDGDEHGNPDEISACTPSCMNATMLIT